MFQKHFPYSCSFAYHWHYTEYLLTAMLCTTKISLPKHGLCWKLHLEYIYVTNYSELSGEVMMSSWTVITLINTFCINIMSRRELRISMLITNEACVGSWHRILFRTWPGGMRAHVSYIIEHKRDNFPSWQFYHAYVCFFILKNWN